MAMKKRFLPRFPLQRGRVHGGFSKLSKETGLNRENLYRALSEHADPRLSTVMHVLNTLKFSLKIA